jgi:2-dehydro-3-deoxygluconokinase
MTRVVCIGECMVELRGMGTDCFVRSFAGDVYNTAVYLKRSLPEAQVQFFTGVGDDSMSASMRAAWRAENIDDGLAFVVQGGSPGLYLIETDDAGERRFQYWRSASAARQWFSMLLRHGEKLLWGADLIYISGIALAILSEEEQIDAVLMLRRLHGHVGKIAFDPNVRASLWPSHGAASKTLRAAFSSCDIALPSTEDLRWLFNTAEPEQQLILLRDLGVREIAMTLGAAGGVVLSGDERAYIKAPAVTRVIDTSGAGDAFNGAYLAARLRAVAPGSAAAAALEVASRVVSHAGAIVPIAVSHG